MNTKPLYKLFILSLFFVLPLSLSQAYADSHNSNTTKTQKTPVEWLYVITAKDGEIKKNEQGQYMLILEHGKIEKVLAFSDRPNRIVKIIPAEKFKNIWGEGKNSFKKDPPNAVAVFGQEKISMILMSVSVDKDKTVFMVSSDDDNMRAVMMGDVSVFVDVCTAPSGICAFHR